MEWVKKEANILDIFTGRNAYPCLVGIIEIYALALALGFWLYPSRDLPVDVLSEVRTRILTAFESEDLDAFFEAIKFFYRRVPLNVRREILDSEEFAGDYEYAKQKLLSLSSKVQA